MELPPTTSAIPSPRTSFRYRSSHADYMTASFDLPLLFISQRSALFSHQSKTANIVTTPANTRNVHPTCLHQPRSVIVTKQQTIKAATGIARHGFSFMIYPTKDHGPRRAREIPTARTWIRWTLDLPPLPELHPKPWGPPEPSALPPAGRPRRWPTRSESDRGAT